MLASLAQGEVGEADEEEVEEGVEVHPRLQGGYEV